MIRRSAAGASIHINCKVNKRDRGRLRGASRSLGLLSLHHCSKYSHLVAHQFRPDGALLQFRRDLPTFRLLCLFFSLLLWFKTRRFSFRAFLTMEATENQVRDAAEPEPPPQSRAPDADRAPQQPTRPSKISRLPGPTTTVHGGGLTEWSESQQNARSQSSIPAPPSTRGLKRELPQSGAKEGCASPCRDMLTSASRSIRGQAKAPLRTCARLPVQDFDSRASNTPIRGQGPDPGQYLPSETSRIEG